MIWLQGIFYLLIFAVIMEVFVWPEIPAIEKKRLTMRLLIGAAVGLFEAVTSTYLGIAYLQFRMNHPNW